MTSNIPIAVFAYNRLPPLQETLSALEQARGYPGGPLVIYCDGPKSNQTTDSEDVYRLRNWLTNWASKRHEVRLVFSEFNKGLRASITGGIAEQLEKYDSVIVLEDDIIVSRSFLEYMHWALRTYQSHEKVAQISGYFVPHRKWLPRLGFLTVPACWGWATWRRAWALYNDDAVSLHRAFPLEKLQQFNIEGSYSYYESLADNAAGRQNTWMVRWYASIFSEQLLTLYPAKSLTRNIGFLHNGTNCSANSMERVFTNQSISHSLPNANFPLESCSESMEFRKALVSFYRWQSDVWATPSAKQRWLNRIRQLVRRIVPK